MWGIKLMIFTHIKPTAFVFLYLRQKKVDKNDYM